MTDRREFMIGCGSVLATAGLPAMSLAAETAANPGGMGRPFGFSRAGFEALLNTRFRVSQGRDALFEARLTQVFQGEARTSHEEFAVVFSASGAVEIPAGLYDFRSSQAGRFKLYIEPIASPGSQQAYMATFGLLA